MADEPQPVPIPVKTAKGVNPTWTAAQMAPETAPASSQPAVPLEQLPLPPGPPALGESAVEPPPPPVILIPTIPSASVPQSDSSSPAPLGTLLSANEPPPLPPVIPPELALVPPARPPLPWRAMRISGGVVVILGLILAFLWWQGILYGAPRAAQRAVQQMGLALAANQMYHVEGRATIDISQSQARSSTDIARTLSATVNFRGDRAGTSKSQATIGVELAGFGDVLPASLPTVIEIEERQIDDQLYLRLPILALFIGSDENRWLGLAAGDINDAVDQLKLTDVTADKLDQLIRKGERLGYERIGPVKTAHYRLELDPRQVAALYRDADQTTLEKILAATSLTVELWLGVRDSLPYQIKIVGYSAGPDVTVTVTATTTLSGYGQAVTITAPDPSEVSFEGLAGLLPTDWKAVQIRARDGQRKADLRQLQSALELYYGDHGRYPDSQGKIARSNDRGAALRVLTEQGYLAVLPVDPNDPNQWYGYVSQGGDHYELWSLLENRTDPDGFQRDAYYIYLLTDTKVAVAPAPAALTPAVSPTVFPSLCGSPTGEARLPARC